VTILEAAQALRQRTVSSAELTVAALRRTGEINPKLNAMITVLEQSARAQAQAADAELARGADRGPLHGIPVAVKDVFETRGVRTTAGSVIFMHNVPARDATVVEKLAAAGAVLVGKTGMHELAYGVTSNNPHFGAVRNPWDTDRIPGGSSGGSGVLPLDFSLDHMGPLTRSVRDAAVTLAAIAGFDPRDETSSQEPVGPYLPAPDCSIRNVRIGLPQNFYLERLDPDVDMAVRRMAATAESLGARVIPVRVPDIEALNTVGRVILLAEASAVMEKYIGNRDQFGADVLSLLDQGRLLPATDYVNAQRLRRVMQREYAQLWSKIDCLFTPTTPMAAPRIGEKTVSLGEFTDDVRLATTRFVRGINVLGLPAISMPCGADRRGLPLGLQIIGRPFDEALILQVAAALEDATGKSARPVPPI
jgi:aspartyl-tRNA(Asn)/glutamyl-tRNA(Gln) amidotransferase subunit A